METEPQINTNINNESETEIYIDLTDEEFLYVISFNLPNFLINNKYVNDRLKRMKYIC